MYKIIGADQREYGPVSADQIRQWMREGRANATTLIQAEGVPGWRPLSTFPEFATPPHAPAVPPYTTPVSQTNNSALTGLIFGILSVTCPCTGLPVGVIGIIFSCMALSQFNHNPAQKGRGMATAGLILSIIGVMIWLGGAVVPMAPHLRLHRHWSF
jgi:hypothetical protein